MRKARFDVPVAMQHIYDQLERLGFKARITSAPSEWDNNQGAWVRFLHVHGEVEVTFRPSGKKTKDDECKWRISPATNNITAFTGWLDGIIIVVQMACVGE